MIGFFQKHQKTVFLTLLALISAGAGVYIAVCTQYALWGFSDSAAYLSAARNFAAGKGLGLISADGNFAPLLIFAPFYSVFLSLFALFNADLIVTVRILDILFFTILVAASGWLFYKITSSFWLGLCFAVMIATTPVLGVSFTSIMSEPLAMVLSIPGFLLLIYALKQNSTKWLLLSALLTGLSLLTRYAFAAIPAAGVLCVLLLSNQPLRKRLFAALKFGLVSFTPMLAWIAVQLFSKFSVGSRTYSMDFSLTEKISQFASQLFAVLKYWLPYRTNMIPGVRAEVFRPILLLLFAAVIVVGLYLSINKSKASERGHTETLAIALGLVITTYLLVLLVIYTISTETISIDDRMLSPIIPMLYSLLLACAQVISRKLHPNLTFPFLGVVIALFFVVFNIPTFKAYPIVVGNYPNGYTSPVWKENLILTGEVALPQERPLITNAPDIVLFYLNRSAYTLSTSAKAGGSDLFIGDQARLEDMLYNQCAVLVLFNPDQVQRFEGLPNAVTAADIAALQGQLDTVYSSANGIVLEDNECNN